MKPLILALALTLAAASLSAQEVRPPAAPMKDTGTSTLLSVLLAGGGQIYSGETEKGILLLTGAVLPVAIGASQYKCYTEGFAAWCDATPLQIGMLVSAVVWAYGVYDAPRAAERANERNGYAPRTSVRPEIGVGRAGEVRLGLAVRR